MDTITAIKEASARLSLSSSDTERLQSLALELNPNDPSALSQFAAVSQTSLARISDAFFAGVSERGEHEAAALEEILKLTSNINLRPLTEEENFLSRLLQRKQWQLRRLSLEQEEVCQRLDELSDALKDMQERLLKDSAQLDLLVEQNTLELQTLTLYLSAGRIVMEEGGLSAENLPLLQKRMDELQLIRLSSLKTEAQIRMIQENSNNLSNRMLEIINHFVPLWEGLLRKVISQALQETTPDNEALTDEEEPLPPDSLEQLDLAFRGLIKATGDALETLQAARHILNKA